jgi:hypothetical protein
MPRLSSKLARWEHGDQNGLVFFCPACNSPHTISTSAGGWTWNGSAERPTFSPSVLVTHDAKPDASEEFKEWRTARACHSFVTDGQIQFLGDCTHALAGQTVPLADFPEGYGTP